MSTKKDLVEAYAFSRRRLVTAFLSGAPGGREVEPTKPSRGIVGGIALAVLLCAGAAIAGFLGGRPNSNWLEKGSFVISKDTGEQYVVLRGGDDPVIQRVPNFVSAQLLLGEAAPDVYSVKDKYIRDVNLGEDLGIDQAPAGVPATDELIESGWTACTGDATGIKLNVDRTPQVTPEPTGAFAVKSESGGMWLIAASPEGEAHRFPFPRNATDRSSLLDALGFGAAELAPVVADPWLDLFPLGSGGLDADDFGVTRAGEPVDYSGEGTDLSAYRIGNLLEVEGGYYLLADDAPQRLDEFAAQVYRAVAEQPQQLATPLNARFRPAATPEDWPDAVPTAVRDGEMCAVLQTDDDGGSYTTLGSEPTEDASSEDVAPGSHEVDVDPSGGAYVLSGGETATEGGGDGMPYVVDAKGFKYALIGPLVAEYIGYGGYDAPVVRDAWLEFFEAGVNLSVNDARRKPENSPDVAS